MTHWKHAMTLLVSVLTATAVAADAPAPAIPSIKAHKSLLLDVATAGKRLVAVGERGHIVVSDDNGNSWRQVKVPVRSLLTAVYFANERTGWAVGHESVVLATQDAGENWVVQNYKEFNPAAVAAEEDLDAEMALEDEMAYDEDMDAEESRSVGSREGVPLLDVWFSDNNNGIAVGAYGLMLRTRDGGKNWSDVSDSVQNSEGWHFNAIAGLPGQSSVVLIAGEKGTLYRSSDGGSTFAPASSPYGGSFFGAYGTREGSLYVFGLQGSLFRSTDGGIGWTRVETGISSGLNDGCQTAQGDFVVTGNAGVMLSGGAGQNAFAVEKRSDRQSILSCAIAGDQIVLVGEGGAKLSPIPKKTP